MENHKNQRFTQELQICSLSSTYRQYLQAFRSNSDIIGKIVMETLSRIDTVAYVRFASVYKNFQELGDFEDFMSDLHPSKLEPKKTV